MLFRERESGPSPGSFEHILEQPTDDMPAIICAGAPGTGTETYLGKQNLQRTMERLVSQ
jgi:hypothetical protein